MLFFIKSVWPFLQWTYQFNQEMHFISVLKKSEKAIFKKNLRSSTPSNGLTRVSLYNSHWNLQDDDYVYINLGRPTHIEGFACKVNIP